MFPFAVCYLHVLGLEDLRFRVPRMMEGVMTIKSGYGLWNEGVALMVREGLGVRLAIAQ